MRALTDKLTKGEIVFVPINPDLRARIERATGLTTSSHDQIAEHIEDASRVYLVKVDLEGTTYIGIGMANVPESGFSLAYKNAHRRPPNRALSSDIHSHESGYGHGV